MELLERLWEIVTSVLGGIASAIERGITSLFGSYNANYVKRLQSKVDAINALEPKYQAMSDDQLRQQTAEFRKRLAAGETLDDLLVEAFAVCREGGRRYINMRHYDVQLVGGMILHAGNIAEMVTGEGKTLVATLAAYLNALEGKGVHVVTVNDYLARRDMEWMGPIYLKLGLTVGNIQSGMNSAEKQEAYACDITYGTNNEFGFDYLRDNMRMAARGDDVFPKNEQQCQGNLHYAIVDEVDNILIDEARTPLIISGPAHDDITRYAHADRIARQLKKELHFEVKEKEHTVSLTDDGVREAEKLAGVESFYTAGNMEWPHLIDNSLKAHYLYRHDVNYVVQNGEVIIVDEFTGRLMPGRNWSDGLHQAVEAKEGVTIKQENQTLATVTLQNFFKLYKKISGMTGTAMTEANEFWKIYQLDVVAVPTNREMQRLNSPDVIYRTEQEKFNAIADEIEAMHKWDRIELNNGEVILCEIQQQNENEAVFIRKGSKKKETIAASKIKNISGNGRPVLVGTVSIEKSERLSGMLQRRGIPHEVLNAKYHGREADIISQAGRKAAVTIATNMAGRGTDIVLGGNPETMAWAQLQDKYPTRLEVPQDEWNALVEEINKKEHMGEEGRVVSEHGGLHVIGTERHESRRIDLQLRGRCGRQGDPGSSRFFLSLEDDLMRIFAGEWVKNILTRLGMQEGEAIESKMVSRRIEGAQKKVEERNFEIRKNLLEYDEVMDLQRKRIYGFRQGILQGDNCKELILDMIERQVAHNLDIFLEKDYGVETYAKWASSLLGVELDPRDFHGIDFEMAQRYSHETAERMVEGQVFDAIEENLPENEDPSTWNWDALTKMVNARWKMNLRDRDLRKTGRDHLAEMLIEKSREALRGIDLSEGKRCFNEHFALETAIAWVYDQFAVRISLEDVKELDPQAFKQLVFERAKTAYDEKEAVYPVMAGLYQFTMRDASGQRRFDRDQLVHWASQRFETPMDVEDLKNKQREEIHSLLVDCSHKHQKQGASTLSEAKQQVQKLFDGHGGNETAGVASGGNGALDSLSSWLKERLKFDLEPQQIAGMDQNDLERKVVAAVDEHYRPEMRRLERFLLLQILDTGWKEHLLVMDHLRSSVGLRGYAQLDPKVEYKREGMRAFESMWNNLADQTTKLVFRMERLDEQFVRSTWTGGEAVHESPPTSSDIGEQQKQAISGSENKARPEPFRRNTPKVGRNDPCPCGSGKKYKNCCLRRQSGS